MYYNQDGQDGLEESDEDGFSPPGYFPLENPPAYSVINNLGIGAVIHTIDGAMPALWYNGGSSFTQDGHEVLWGYFHLEPVNVPWCSKDNPELFVKIYFDMNGRIDVNFFHSIIKFFSV